MGEGRGEGRPSSQGGVALVVTLLMLSVITIVVVAFLSLSRRERSSVSTTINYTDSKTMADFALERAKGQVFIPILATTNMHSGGLAVSRNYINPLGFNAAFSYPTNVNYAYPNGQPLNPADFLANLTNLLIDPRPPVYVRTNRPGTITQASNEFRFYIDLNRNGRFETNGFYLPYDDLGNPIGTNLFFFVGDPEWIGVLEKPNLPHSPNNRFIGRYAYLIQPVGKSLDLNFIHNQSQALTLFGQPNRRYYRNQGFGTYEINLAAFLALLNTNTVWFANYYYGSDGVCAGEAFQDALDLVRYRYNGDYDPTYDTVQGIFGPNAPAFTMDRIDGLARPVDFPPISGLFSDDLITHPWPGANSRQHFYTLHDFFKRGRTPPYDNFINRLTVLFNKANSYDRYTFYRMLAQLGTDTAEEPTHADIPDLMRQIGAQKPEEFLADTVGRINLNYDNINFAASDFVNWEPLTFFTNVGNILLREQYPFGITNIPVGISNRWYYPSTHRLLQVAANIYDGANTDLFPTVYLPIVGKVLDPFTNNGSVITGVSGYALCANRAQADRWAATNDYDLPAVVGAKKGIPNFNEFVFQTAVQVVRKLELSRPTTNSLPNQTNQIMILAVSNVFGVETFNSYSKPFTNLLQICITNAVSIYLSNAIDKTIYPPSGPALLLAGVVTNRSPQANDRWFFKPRFPFNINTEGGFIVPLYTNTLFLAPSRYNGQTFDSATNSFVRDGQLPIADWRLVISNRLTYIASTDLQGTNKVIDITCLSYQTNMNLTEFLLQEYNGETDQTTGTSLTGLWDTNRYSPAVTASTPTEGVLKQLRISLGYEPLSDGFWKDYNVETRDKQQSIQEFKNFVGNTNGNADLHKQAPFSASRRFVHTVSFQANDPLVHYMADDLKDLTNHATVRFLKPADGDVFTNNLGRLNERYRPWLGNPGKETGDEVNPNDVYVGVKDPGVYSSDDWDFPSQKFPSIGWLGRIHRGTPWQTVYLKAEVASPMQWLRQSLDIRTHPTNDWRLLDIFTVAQTPNVSHGQLSINQSEIAAWTAVLGSVTVLTNTVVDINARVQTNFGRILIEPRTNAPVIQAIVDGITRERLRRPNQVFRSLGELLSVPELTSRSPFLNLMADPASQTSAETVQTYSFTDETYERIPRQILSLLKVGDARYIIYSFGQALKPADNSIVTSSANPAFFGLCTNYQITGEVYTRTLIKIDGTARNPKPVVLNYNILPAE